MAYDKDQVDQEFTRWSNSYDRSILQWLLFGPSHRVLIRRIRDVAGDRPSENAGCGLRHGSLCVPGARRRCLRLRSAALTWSPKCFKRESRGGALDRAHVLPVRGDSERLPFESGAFDIVTCANSFHHYPRQERAVAEMRRVLRPGGRLMIIDGYRDAPWGWFIYDVCVAGVEGEVHHASARRFRELFEQAGLQAVSQRVHRGPAPFLITEAVAAEPLPLIPAPHFRFAAPRPA